MNDEYLWQKTGDDPEIERLEKSLAAFRYVESDPPAIPVAITSHKRSWFTFAFAATAFAAVLIAVSVFVYSTRQSHNDEVTFVSTPAADDPEPKPVEVQPAVTQPPAAEPSSPEKRPTRRMRRIEVQSATIVRPKRHSAPNHDQPGVVATTLTKEERYAYRQLMLALSITSSKLSVVRNTIDGVEEKENDAKQNNR